MDAGPGSADALPDDILQLVFAHVGIASAYGRGAIGGVCRRWRGLLPNVRWPVALRLQIVAEREDPTAWSSRRLRWLAALAEAGVALRGARIERLALAVGPDLLASPPAAGTAPLEAVTAFLRLPPASAALRDLTLDLGCDGGVPEPSEVELESFLRGCLAAHSAPARAALAALRIRPPACGARTWLDPPEERLPPLLAGLDALETLEIVPPPSCGVWLHESLPPALEAAGACPRLSALALRVASDRCIERAARLPWPLRSLSILYDSEMADFPGCPIGGAVASLASSPLVAGLRALRLAGEGRSALQYPSELSMALDGPAVAALAAAAPPLLESLAIAARAYPPHSARPQSHSARPQVDETAAGALPGLARLPRLRELSLELQDYPAPGAGAGALAPGLPAAAAALLRRSPALEEVDLWVDSFGRGSDGGEAADLMRAARPALRRWRAGPEFGAPARRPLGAAEASEIAAAIDIAAGAGAPRLRSLALSHAAGPGDDLGGYAALAAATCTPAGDAPRQAPLELSLTLALLPGGGPTLRAAAKAALAPLRPRWDARLVVESEDGDESDPGPDV
eukprot:tig00020562_g11134.t1